MAAMLIVHFVDPSSASTAVLGDTLGLLAGRAMPLFMVLGGVGATIVSNRAVGADRRLLVRAGVLLALGLLLEVLDTPAVPILTTYGLLFLLAVLLRRLRTKSIVLSAAVVAVLSTWTSQVLGTVPSPLSVEMLIDPTLTVWVLVFGGAYPLLPTAGFFMIGMAIGRQSLRDRRYVTSLVLAGMTLALMPLMLRSFLVEFAGFDARQVGRDWATFTPVVTIDPSGFDWSMVLDTSAHSQMLGWTFASAGTALVVLGLALLLAEWTSVAMGWMEAIGRLALTFYVLQLVLTDHVTSPLDSSFNDQIIVSSIIWFGFALYANLWIRFVGVGPLERLLRIGVPRASGSKTPGPPPDAVDPGAVLDERSQPRAER